MINQLFLVTAVKRNVDGGRVERRITKLVITILILLASSDKIASKSQEVPYGRN